MIEEWQEADAPREGWQELPERLWEKVEGDRVMRVEQVSTAYVWTIADGDVQLKGVSSRLGFAMLGAEIEGRAVEQGRGA